MTDTEKCPAFGYDCEYVAKVETQAAEIARLREALNYAWDLIEEASYSDSVMGVKQDRFLSTYYDENGLRAALGETEWRS